jgi:hypothetical protein
MPAAFHGRLRGRAAAIMALLAIFASTSAFVGPALNVATLFKSDVILIRFEREMRLCNTATAPNGRSAEERLLLN